MAQLKLISWNMNQKASNWQAVLDSNVDVAMLQEAKAPPSGLADKFITDQEECWKETGMPWRAVTAAVVSSDKIDYIPVKTQPLGGNDPKALMVSRPGSLAAAAIKIKESGEEITIVSMYANWANPIRQTGSRWIFADASAHRLISDLCGLVGMQRGHKIIAAGDLNILYGYGEGGSIYWKNRYDTVFDRMTALGLCLVGPQTPDGGRQADLWPDELPKASLNVPTFHTNSKTLETAERQFDFVFASESIAGRVNVRALNRAEEWGPATIVSY